MTTRADAALATSKSMLVTYSGKPLSAKRRCFCRAPRTTAAISYEAFDETPSLPMLRRLRGLCLLTVRISSTTAAGIRGDFKSARMTSTACGKRSRAVGLVTVWQRSDSAFLRTFRRSSLSQTSQPKDAASAEPSCSKSAGAFCGSTGAPAPSSNRRRRCSSRQARRRDSLARRREGQVSAIAQVNMCSRSPVKREAPKPRPSTCRRVEDSRPSTCNRIDLPAALSQIGTRATFLHLLLLVLSLPVRGESPIRLPPLTRTNSGPASGIGWLR